LPVSRAISKVFLAVHGVEREYAIAQAHGGDQRLRGGDLQIDRWKSERRVLSPKA